MNLRGQPLSQSCAWSDQGTGISPLPGGRVSAGMIGVREGRQTTVNSPQLKREEPDRKSEERLTAETLSTQRSERREEREPDFKTEGTEVGDTEVAEKIGPDSEWEWGASMED
jgi:hypothetical protein